MGQWRWVENSIEVGDILEGFCGGYFGRDSFGDKLVEGVGRDWVVARDRNDGRAYIATGNPAQLDQYRKHRR